MLVVASLAGIALSEDGGRTWSWPMPGVLGPFVHDVAISPDHGLGMTIFAATASSLFRSFDRGGSWSSVGTEVRQVLALRGGGVLVVDHAGGLLRGSGQTGELALWPVMTPDWRFDSVTVDPKGSSMAALSNGCLVRSVDLGNTWTPIPEMAGLHDVAIAGSGTVLAAAETAGVLIHRIDGTWSHPSELGDQSVSGVAIDESGDFLLAGLDHGVALSTDAGASWQLDRIDGRPSTIAAAPDGRAAFVGLSDGRCMAWDRSLNRWTLLRELQSAVVATLVAGASDVVATSFGSIARSVDGGRAWTSLPLPADRLAPVPAATDPATGRVHVAAVGRLFGVDGSGIVTLPTEEVSVVAIRTPDGAAEIAVSDGRSVWGRVADGWIASGPPVDLDEHVEALAFGSLGSHPAGDLLAATRGSSGLIRLWAHRGDRWQAALAHDSRHGRCALATVEGPRGAFVAVDDVVYRPAAVGDLLLVAERPAGPSRPSEVLSLSACRAAGDVAVAVLRTDGIYVSVDGGLNWRPLPKPDGPPITALALVPEGDGVGVLAAHLGGRISRLLIT